MSSTDLQGERPLALANQDIEWTPEDLTTLTITKRQLHETNLVKQRHVVREQIDSPRNPVVVELLLTAYNRLRNECEGEQQAPVTLSKQQRATAKTAGGTTIEVTVQQLDEVKDLKEELSNGRKTLDGPSTAVMFELFLTAYRQLIYEGEDGTALRPVPSD